MINPYTNTKFQFDQMLRTLINKYFILFYLSIISIYTLVCIWKLVSTSYI
jgi:hypothetical protein